MMTLGVATFAELGSLLSAEFYAALALLWDFLMAAALTLGLFLSNIFRSRACYQPGPRRLFERMIEALTEMFYGPG